MKPSKPPGAPEGQPGSSSPRRGRPATVPIQPMLPPEPIEDVTIGPFEFEATAERPPRPVSVAAMTPPGTPSAPPSVLAAPAAEPPVPARIPEPVPAPGREAEPTGPPVRRRPSGAPPARPGVPGWVLAALGFLVGALCALAVARFTALGPLLLGGPQGAAAGGPAGAGERP